eukprot:15477853-Alexandrium_andersonii.AAC.1
MARVRLIQEPVWRPPNDAVQPLHPPQVRRASAQAHLEFAHELLVRLLLHDVEVGIVAREGEVVPVHDAPRPARHCKSNTHLPCPWQT